jgi:hypothetical protein
MARQRLSRLQFIAGGSALLAGCSGAGGAGNTMSSLLGNSPSAGTAAGSTASGSGALAISSNATTTSFAAHTSSGQLFVSKVVGQNYVRYTGPSGSFVTPKVLPQHHSWYQISNVCKFRYKTFKSGKHGILSVDAKGNRVLFHIGKGGHLYVRDQHGHTGKIALGFDPTLPANSESTGPSPYAPALAALNKLITSPGTWHGDDDFASKEAAITGKADLLLKHPRPSFTRAKRAAAMSARAEESAFGDYYGDAGGGGGDFSGSDGADGGDGDGDHGVDCTTQTGGGPMTSDCWWDIAGLAGAVLVFAAAGGAGAGACVVGGVFTFGASCALALAGVLGSAVGIASAWHAYTKDNCPTVSVSCSSS